MSIELRAPVPPRSRPVGRPIDDAPAVARIGQPDTRGNRRRGISVVVPVYNGCATIERVVAEIVAVLSDQDVEVILVNDGSADASQQVCAALVEKYPDQVVFVQLARNFGEHNAVMAGLRESCGDFAAVVDDDGQHPAADVLRMLEHARSNKLDVVYGRFQQRCHPPLRILGSWAVNRMADFLLKKPRGLYLSSFKVMSRFAVDEVCRYRGPVPYVDGLVLRVTSRIAQIEVTHRPRAGGRSGYNLSKLLALWLAIVVEYSIAPFRAALAAGLACVFAGATALSVLLALRFFGIHAPSWSWIGGLAAMGAGLQVFTVGALGEYASRLMMHHSGMPQHVLRSVTRGLPRDERDEAPCNESIHFSLSRS